MTHIKEIKENHFVIRIICNLIVRRNTLYFLFNHKFFNLDLKLLKRNLSVSQLKGTQAPYDLVNYHFS